MLIFVLLATLFTAADLQKDCTSSVPFERAFCLGYLTGFGHAATLATDLTKATTAIRVTSLMDGCPSDEVSTEQARLVFLKCVDNHPEELAKKGFLDCTCRINSDIKPPLETTTPAMMRWTRS